jgi:hypothetical protein
MDVEYSIFTKGYEQETWGDRGGAMKLGAFKFNVYFHLFVIRGAVNRPLSFSRADNRSTSLYCSQQVQLLLARLNKFTCNRAYDKETRVVAM